MANNIFDTGTEKNLRMSNGRCARQPIAGVISGWVNGSKVRIALRVKMSDTGGDLARPTVNQNILAVGLCAGGTNIMGDATTDHFVGVGDDYVDASWTRHVGPPIYYTTFSRPGKRVGVTDTFNTILIHDYFEGFNAHFHTGFYKLYFVDIAKGSPNYTISFFGPNAGLATDATNADFLAQSIAAVPVLASHNSTETIDIPVNEAVNGTFTHAAVWWGTSDSTLDIAEFSVIRIA